MVSERVADEEARRWHPPMLRQTPPLNPKRPLPEIATGLQWRAEHRRSLDVLQVAALLPVNALRNAAILLADTPLVLPADMDLLIGRDLSAIASDPKRHATPWCLSFLCENLPISSVSFTPKQSPSCQTPRHDQHMHCVRDKL